MSDAADHTQHTARSVAQRPAVAHGDVNLITSYFSNLSGGEYEADDEADVCVYVLCE